LDFSPQGQAAVMSEGTAGSSPGVATGSE
jgi:hypothetical protein